MRVLVTGGAGFVGRATVRALIEAGHEARIVSRDAWPSGSLFDRQGVEVVGGDPRRPPRETLSDAIGWWAEHDSIDRRLAGRLAPRPA